MEGGARGNVLEHGNGEGEWCYVVGFDFGSGLDESPVVGKLGCSPFVFGSSEGSHIVVWE